MKGENLKTVVKVFEPPMCCPTGICGPTIDGKLADFNDLIERLKKENYVIERYSLTQNPDAFQNEEQVMAIIKDEQVEALPISVIDGEIIKKGAYPTDEDIKNHKLR